MANANFRPTEIPRPAARSAPARRYAIDRVAAKIEPRLKALFDRLPANVSLFTGGVFILVTVFLPLAIDGCGRYGGTGKDLLIGKAGTYWPSWLGMRPFGRWFYIFLLAWAALAIVVALARLLKRDLGRSRIAVLIALAGALSYFVMADFMIFAIIDLDKRLRGGLAGYLLLLCASLAVFLFFRAARAESIRASRFLRRLFLLGGALTALTIAGWAAVVISDAELIDSPHRALRVAGDLLLLSPPALCILAPLALWFRHSLWPMADSARHWPSLRRRLALVCVPVVAGQFYAAYRSFVGPRVWGLALCLAGIHLITLGYLRLRKQAEAARIPVQDADPVRIPAPQA